MNRYMIFITLTFFLSLKALADNNEAKYYQIDKIKITELQNQQNHTHKETHDLIENKSNLLSSFQTLGLIEELDIIINIGEKVWKIIEAGKQVVNVSTKVATALPKGITSMNDLDGWQPPQSKTYKVEITNKLGMTVVSLQYQVITVTGGSINGKGQYVGYASVLPSELFVAWGFNFDANCSAPSIFNVGNKKNPIGALNLVMDYTINTPLSTLRQSQSYYITGLGEISQIQ